MKYKIKLNDSVDLLVVADSELEAVKKAKAIKDSIKDESIEEKVRKAQEWVDYDLEHYGSVTENTRKIIAKEGLDFDKWNNQVHDSISESVELVKRAAQRSGVSIEREVNTRNGRVRLYISRNDKEFLNSPEIVKLYRANKLAYPGSASEYFVELYN